jgi:hypothetical protein
MDNNVLRSPKFDDIVDEIKALGFAKGATFKNPKTGNGKYFSMLISRPSSGNIVLG